MKTETPRDAALRIATKYATPETFAGLLGDAEAALNAERERCAKIADSEAQQATRDEAESSDDFDRGRCRAARAIATDIRGSKQ